MCPAVPTIIFFMDHPSRAASPARSRIQPTPVQIRELTPADALATVRLAEQLGYQTSLQEMQERIHSLKNASNHNAYGACLDQNLIGWIEITATNYLAADPRAEICGLVVSSELRGQGIGRLLLEHASRWALTRGLKTVLVRSRQTREAAHRFYLLEGFVQTKTSFVFTKTMPSATP